MADWTPPETDAPMKGAGRSAAPPAWSPPDIARPMAAKSGPKSETPLPDQPKEGPAAGYQAARAQAKREWSGDNPVRPKYNSLESIAHGATLGISDEINAAGDYLKTLVSQAPHYITGTAQDVMKSKRPMDATIKSDVKLPYTPADAAKASMDEQEEQRTEYDKKHALNLGPLALVPAEIAGGALLPWGKADAALKAAGIAGGVGSGLVRSLLLGGGAGGVSAFNDSRGDAGERSKAIAPGVLAGAATGGALHGANALLGNAGKGLRGGFSEMIDRWRNALGWQPGKPPTATMARSAANRAKEVITESVARADPTGTKLRDNPMEKRGMPVTAAEALGREFETMLKASGRRSGETPDALEAQMRARTSETPTDVVEDFGRITGIKPEEIEGDFNAQATRLRQEAAPLYGEAYKKWGGGEPPASPPYKVGDRIADKGREGQVVGADADSLRLKDAKTGDEWTVFRTQGTLRPTVGDSSGLSSDALQALLKRPSMQAALKRAANLAAEEGRDPQSIGLETTRKPLVMDGQQVRDPKTGGPYMIDETVEVKKPSLQTWDYIKRALDDRLDDFRDSTTRRMKWNEESRGIRGTKSALRDELYKLTRNPDGSAGLYERAVAKGGEPLQLEEAYREAPRLMSAKVTPEAFAKAWKDYTPAQREAHKAGLINDARNKAMAGRQRLGDMLTKSYEQKLVEAFGLGQAKQIIQHLEDRRFLLTHGQRMTPGVGSDTSETLLSTAEQDRAVGDVTRAMRHVFEGRPVTAAGHIITAPLMGSLRAMQVPFDRATRDTIGQLLMMRPSALAQALERAKYSPVERNAFMQFLHNVDKTLNAHDVGLRTRYSAASEVGGETAKEPSEQ